jgi:hypothetical protein
MTSEKKERSVIWVTEDNRSMKLRKKYVERIRSAMTLVDEEVAGLGGDDYISALEEIADDVEMMIVAKREEIAAEEAGDG